LTGAHVNLSEYLGQTIDHDGRLIVPTWHPSYALKMADAGLREEVVAGMVAAFKRAAELAAEEAIASGIPLAHRKPAAQAATIPPKLM
jgi:DNA polymerase